MMHTDDVKLGRIETRTEKEVIGSTGKTHSGGDEGRHRCVVTKKKIG